MPQPKSRKRRSTPTLADLVDMETLLLRDENRDRQTLNARDAQIIAEVDVDSLTDRQLLLHWLDAVRDESSRRETAGDHVQNTVRIIQQVLLVLGLIVGFSAVAGWLQFDLSQPVNSIYFWIAFVGIQVLLLPLFALVVLPSRALSKIPLIGDLHALLRGLAKLLPQLVESIVVRIPHKNRKAIARWRDLARQVDWIYGRIRTWVLLRATQMFALALNVGAIVAFLLVSYASDPTFAWKSTRLDAESLHEITEIVSLPWAAIWPDATLSAEDVAATRVWSISRDALRQGTAIERWGFWWSFLLASLVCYGLIPRILTYAFTEWRVRQLIRHHPFDHARVQKLLLRLRRPIVETTATEDPDANEAGRDRASAAFAPAAPPKLSAGQAIPVVQWSGVRLSQEEIAALLQTRLGVNVTEVHEVGQLDSSRDEAIAGGMQPNQPVAVLVEAWEAPDQEYVDFVRWIREAVGERTLITVLLVNRDESDRLIEADADGIQVWQRRIEIDPWVHVDDLAPEAAV